MSPNLSSKPYPGNKVLYEQVLYSMLHLVGIAKPTNYHITNGYVVVYLPFSVSTVCQHLELNNKLDLYKRTIDLHHVHQL